jgi:hypothetical protein
VKGQQHFFFLFERAAAHKSKRKGKREEKLKKS